MSRYPLTQLEALKAPGRYSMVGGPFGSKLVSRDYVDQGVPVIRGGNLPKDCRFSFDDLVFVTEDKVASDLLGNLAFPGDIVVTQRGTLGQVGLIPSSSPYAKLVVSQSQMKLTVDPAKADPVFVYYALKSPVGQHEIHSRAITAGVPHINLSSFQQILLPCPPLSTQRKIAAILSAYDDLIENNDRRVKLLEESATRLYREWFVDFRYPGHENVRLVDSGLGPIPEGWKVRQLQDVAQADRGLSWDRTQEVESGGLAIITIPNVQARLQLGEMTHLTAVGSADADKYSLKGGDTVLVGSNGNPERVGHAVWIPEGMETLFASFLMRVRSDPSQLGSAVLHMQLKDPRLTDAWRSSAIGSTSLRNIRLTTLRTSSVLVPSVRVLSRTEPILRNLLSVRDSWDRASSILRVTRDLLLPRLVSGQIDVADLDISMPEAAA